MDETEPYPRYQADFTQKPSPLPARFTELRHPRRPSIQLVIIGFVAVGVVFIILFGDKEERPAGVFMSFLVTFAASVIATAAALFARHLQNALRRSEGRRS